MAERAAIGYYATSFQAKRIPLLAAFCRSGGELGHLIDCGEPLKTAQGRAEPRQVESRAVIQSSPAVTVRRAEPIVERALPVGRVPRAEAVGSGQTIDESWLANSSNVGRWAVLTVPSEGSVWAHFRGRISSVDNLPRSAERWDWYQTPSASWIYMAPAATGRLGWMDP